jgi:hypothetical protein
VTGLRVEPVGRFSLAAYGFTPAVLDRLGLARQWDKALRVWLVPRTALPAIEAYAEWSGAQVEVGQEAPTP